MSIRSGIDLIDERLGGLQPGRAYVMTGAPGTGKTIACLEFLFAGLNEGEQVAMLTVDDPGDILAQAEFLGIDLDDALRREQFVLLRYQLDFARRFSRAVSPETAFDELRRLLGPTTPKRLVIDSIAPIVDAGQASGAGVTAALAFLDSLGATSMVTFPGDLAGLYDRRLEPLMQRAGAILHFTAQPDRTGQIEVRKVRYKVPSTAPMRFQINPGTGIVPLADSRARRQEDLPDDTRRKLLLLDLAGGFPAEHLAALRSGFDVSVRGGVTSALSNLMQSAVGAILIDVKRDLVRDAIVLVRELRRSGSRAPIVLMTAYRLRSTDRARALRAGADDFVPADVAPDELLMRVESVARRGRSTAQPVVDADVPLVTQPQNGNGFEPFEGDAFRDAVRAHITGDRIPFFTIVTVRVAHGEAADLSRLALHTMRVEGGDLVGVDGDEVSVYLHSARRKDITPFIERLREEWRHNGHGELEIDALSYPADEQRVQSMLGQPA
ncbi:MAG TPA: ATPase domain-containing protein [Gemmatimonadaceae bacterium]|nr:ATPase domain-containing protein [Gemmatimonadaceae bacterium]